VEDKFGAYDYRRAIQELLSMKQQGSVEEYTKEFEAVQFQVSMFNTGFDDMFFTAQYVNGLKDEIKLVVQTQLPDSLTKASVLARIQQQVWERTKFKPQKGCQLSLLPIVPKLILHHKLLLLPCGRRGNCGIIGGQIICATFVGTNSMPIIYKSAQRGPSHSSMYWH
jgi:hypothetical protein